MKRGLAARRLPEHPSPGTVRHGRLARLTPVLIFVLGAGIRTPLAAEQEKGSGPGVKAPPRGCGESRREETVVPTKPLDFLNRRLPDWIRVGGQLRFRPEATAAYNFIEDASDAYLLSRLRLNLEIRLSSRLHVLVQGQDSRAFAVDPDRASKLEDFADLRQAYVDLRMGPGGAIGLRVGRQEMGYGDERLVGFSNWSNTSQSFDAAKVELALGRFRIDAFASSVVKIDRTHFNTRRRGENLYGAYGMLDRPIQGEALEIYYLRKTAKQQAGERAVVGDLGLNTVGLRLSSRRHAARLRPFEIKTEIAKQWGALATNDVSAWAGYVIVDYALHERRPVLALSAEFSYASGDPVRDDGKIQTFDQLYPTNHSKYGIVDSVGWRNIQDLRLGTKIQGLDSLEIRLDYHSFWLANRNDDLYSGGSVIVPSPVGGASRSHVGHETDVIATYTMTPHLSLGAGLGHLFPGGFLKESSSGAGSTFCYAFVQCEL